MAIASPPGVKGFWQAQALSGFGLAVAGCVFRRWRGGLRRAVSESGDGRGVREARSQRMRGAIRGSFLPQPVWFDALMASCAAASFERESAVLADGKGCFQGVCEKRNQLLKVSATKCHFPA